MAFKALKKIIVQCGEYGMGVLPFKNLFYILDLIP